jgi:RNA polymerase sigma-70 factor (ECF subfamily)
VPAGEAEDLTAETFSRAWERIGSYEDRGVPFVAWLYTIASNLITSRGRTIQRRGVPDMLPSDLPAEGFEEGVVSRLDHQVLTERLAALKPAHRRVLELRFLGEHSVAETARLLGTTEEGVRSLTYRALAALRQELRLTR